MKFSELEISEYSNKENPDFLGAGNEIESVLRSWDIHGPIAIRAISLKDHKNISREDLIAKIRECGTDRYDPYRKGVHHDLDKEYSIDLHAIALEVTEKNIVCPHYSENRCSTGNPISELLLDCYEGAKVDRGYPLRVDLLLVFDLEKLQPAPMMWKENGPEYTKISDISPMETTTFQFKDPDNKTDALAGIISIA